MLSNYHNIRLSIGVMLLIIVVFATSLIIPTYAYEVERSPPNSISFDIPMLNGDTTEGCFNLQGSVKRWTDNSTVVSMARSGIGVFQVMFGTQTPQWFYICEYNGRNYVYPAETYYEYAVMDEVIPYYLTHPFTGASMGIGQIKGPYFANPFEYINRLGSTFSTLDVKNDNGEFRITMPIHGAIISHMEFLPLDDILKIKIHGIYDDHIEFEVNIPDELAIFDWKKYDGQILVNGNLTSIPFKTERPLDKFDAIIVIDGEPTRSIKDIKISNNITKKTRTTVYVKNHAWHDLNMGNIPRDGIYESANMYKKWYTIEPGIESPDPLSEYKQLFRKVDYYTYDGDVTYTKVPDLYKRSTWKKHNTSTIVNDIITNMSHTSHLDKHKEFLIILIDIKGTKHQGRNDYKSSEPTVKEIVHMNDHGWSKPGIDEIHTRAKNWYHELYGDWYFNEFGRITDDDTIYKYLRISGNNPEIPPNTSVNHFDNGNIKTGTSYNKYMLNLVSYHDAVLDIEIPLVIKDKDAAYTSSYPEIGWCREPLTLVAKTATTKDAAKPTAACVHQDSIPKLVKRGWAQHTPQVPQQLQDKFKGKLANETLVYKYGNAKPMDSFRASLFGLPHIDDIEMLGEISPRLSNNHTLQEILSPELLDVIKPSYSNATFRYNDIGATLQDYQDKHKVCKDGYDYYFDDRVPSEVIRHMETKWYIKHGFESGKPEDMRDKKFVIVQFNC